MSYRVGAVWRSQCYKPSRRSNMLGILCRPGRLAARGIARWPSYSPAGPATHDQCSANSLSQQLRRRTCRNLRPLARHLLPGVSFWGCGLPSWD